VGEHAPREVDRPAPGLGLARHVHVGLGGDQRGETAAHGGLVVGHEHADHARRR
jgi:hypothetical protein